MLCSAFLFLLPFLHYLLYKFSIIVTLYLACRCTIGLNVGLMILFLSLAITFFLLAAGVTSHRANKVCNTLLCPAVKLVHAFELCTFTHCAAARSVSLSDVHVSFERILLVDTSESGLQLLPGTSHLLSCSMRSGSGAG